MDTNLDNLNAMLTKTSTELDEAASMIRDLSLNNEVNIQRIGEALVNIYDIQNEIYLIRPDLKPDYLNE